MILFQNIIKEVNSIGDNKLILFLFLIYLFYSGYKDSTKFIIPQKVSLAFVIARLALFFIYPIEITHVLGAIAPFMLFWIIAASLNQNMGGDIKFIGAVGFWLGLNQTLLVIVLSALLILAVDMYYRFYLKEKYKTPYALYFLISYILLYMFVR